MADTEDQESKTEDPTQHKLNKLREDGVVPTSREVNHLLAMVGLALVLGVVGPLSLGHLAQLFAAMLQNAGTTQLEDAPGIGQALLSAMYGGLLTLLPILGVMLVAGVIGGIIQNGLIFSTKPLEFDWQKVSPMAGFGRLFSLKSLAEMLKGVIKLGIISSAVGAIVWAWQGRLPLLAAMEIPAGLSTANQLMLWCMGAILGIVAFIALADFLFQRFQFFQQHRMSREELKREFKETEGDPHIKQRQKQIRTERARKRMMSAVPKASVVVTNPTHYSVALRYRPDEGDAAPVVVAKGADFVAMRIREVAQQHNIPLYPDPPLARQIYASVELDQQIPVALFEAVAKVIAFIAKLKKAT